ncbi:hypothetical protein NM688_g424 [Phlebia brevispora]|uniref:Uncharacterized protein n=1 Tax=Phlebia brevispora TaxID=194682 RepID=A0ACC1TE50_9APHY|nr:hypothetical protein NM688_g424 [Phlebia brevispora]
MPNLAQSHKDKGNQAFKAADYASAVGHYTTAILADPEDYTYPLNRAAAYLKLGKYKDAERDCTTVLRLNQKNVKAWFRRGQARIALGQLEQAQSDFQQALRLDNQNEAARIELKKVGELMRDTSKPARSYLSIDTIQMTLCLTSQPPEINAPTPKRRRVPITIVDPSSLISVSVPPTYPQSPDQATSSRYPEPSQQEHMAQASLQAPSQTPANPVSPQNTSLKEIKQKRGTGLQRPGGGIFRHNGQHTIFKTAVSPAGDAEQGPSADNDSQAAGRQHTAAISAVRSSVELHDRVVPLPDITATTATTTLFDFNRSWNSLNTFQERWKLLVDNVPPAALPTLFKTSLEASLLTSLLKTFDDMLKSHGSSLELQAAIRGYMLNFTRVARFSTVILLMDRKERSVATAVWGRISSSQVGEAEGRAKQAWKVA